MTDPKTLLNWALSNGFTPGQKVDEAALQSLCRDQSMQKNWKHLMSVVSNSDRNIHPKTSIPKLELRNHTKELENEVQKLENDILTIRKELVRTSKSLDVARTDRHDNHLREGLRIEFAASCKKNIQVFDHVSRLLSEHTSRCLRSSELSKEAKDAISRSFNEHVGVNKSEFEPRLTPWIRRVQESIKRCLAVEEDATANTPTTNIHEHEHEHEHANQIDVIAQCRRVHGSASPLEVLSGLCVLTASDRDQVLHQLHQKDINVGQQHALPQSLEQEHSGNFGNSTSSGPLKSVRNLMEASQRDHIKRYVKTQQDHTHVRTSQIELEALQKKIHDLQQECFSNPSSLQLERECHALAMQTTALEAGLGSLKNCISDVRFLAESRQKDFSSLQAKFDKIQNFGHIVSDKEKAIQQLINANAEAKIKILNERSQIVASVSKTYTDLLTSLQSAIHNSSDWVINEDDQLGFTPILDIDYIMDGMGCARKVIDLSIHRMTTERNDYLGDLISLPEMLQSYHGSDRILPACVALKDTVGQNHDNLDDILRVQLPTLPDQRFINGLEERCTRQDTVLLTERVPVLEGCVRNADAAIRLAARGHSLVDDWIHMHAQYLVPSLRRSGLSVQEWHDKTTLQPNNRGVRTHR